MPDVMFKGTQGDWEWTRVLVTSHLRPRVLSVHLFLCLSGSMDRDMLLFHSAPTVSYHLPTSFPVQELDYQLPNENTC